MSEGFCDVDFSEASDDADYVEFCESSVVKARKAHKCDECRGGIAAGDVYTRTAYRFEGKFHMERKCALCKEAAVEFGYSVLGGLLWEQFNDAWDNGANVQGCINRLTTAKAKAHMCQQWIKWHDARARQRQEAIARRAAASRPGGEP